MEQNKTKNNEKSDFWGKVFSVITAIFSIFNNYIFGNKKSLIFGAFLIVVIGALFVRNVKSIIVITIAFLACISLMLIEEYKFESEEEKIYAQAVEYVTEEKYKIAIVEFRKLSDDFIEEHEVSTKINDTEQMYKREIINEADLLAEKNNYTEAIQLLHEANEFLNGETEIEMKIKSIKELEVQNVVQTLFDNKEYEEAIMYIKRKIEDGINSASINELLKRAEEEYWLLVTKQVDKYIREQKFMEAKELLDSATDVLGENDQINKKLEEIEAKEPKLLSDFEKEELGQCLGLEEIYDYQDVFENVYEGISYGGDVSTLMDPFTYGNSFFINSKYKYLRGTLTVLDNRKKGTITFYNGDNTIREYTIDISKDKPYEIEVNLEDVNLLNIVMAGSVLANAKLYTE